MKTVVVWKLHKCESTVYEDTTLLAAASLLVCNISWATYTSIFLDSTKAAEVSIQGAWSLVAKQSWRLHCLSSCPWFICKICNVSSFFRSLWHFSLLVGPFPLCNKSSLSFFFPTHVKGCCLLACSLLGLVSVLHPGVMFCMLTLHNMAFYIFVFKLFSGDRECLERRLAN